MNQEPKIYLTRAGRSGEDEERVFEYNVAIVGFQEVPSLATATDYENVHEIVTGAFHDVKARAVGNFAGQLWAFAVAMKEGDLVVLPRKLTSQIAIGRVTGPYEYRQVDDAFRHTRPVEWLQTDLPRTVFEQDLLYSLGAFMTVCNISRNDAERRVASVAEGKPDPGPSVSLDTQSTQVPGLREHSEGLPDLSQLAHDQIVAHIQARFSGHALAALVNAVLRAEGWLTKPSPPGADGGVDILAGRGSLGLDEPRLCVQPWRRRLYLPAYRIRDAARYSGVAAQTVTHWHHGDGRLGPALPGHQKRRHLSYLQLVEVAFVATFRMLGVPLQRIRRARAYAALTGKRSETAYTSKEVWAAA